MGEPIAQLGTPVPFRWDAVDCVGLLDDVQRYEKELTELLDSDDSAWASADVVRFTSVHPLQHVFHPIFYTRIGSEGETPKSTIKYRIQGIDTHLNCTPALSLRSFPALVAMLFFQIHALHFALQGCASLSPSTRRVFIICEPCMVLQKGGKLGFRLATGVQNPAPVSRFVFEVDSKQDAKTLFTYMMTVKGFQLIDPFHNDSLAKSRANPTETCAHCFTTCADLCDP